MKINTKINIASMTLAVIVLFSSTAHAAEMPNYLPNWVSMENSPLKSKVAKSRLNPFLVKISSTSPMIDHQSKSEAQLDHFAIYHTNLIAKLDRTYPILERSRDAIIERIEAGRGDMTEAKMHMTIAEEKMSLAKDLAESLRSYIPPVLQNENVAATTSIELAIPRKLGKEAIEAIKEAKTALHNTIVALAKTSGFAVGENGKVEPKAK